MSEEVKRRQDVQATIKIRVHRRQNFVNKMVYTHVSRVWDGLIPFLKGLVRSVPRRNLTGAW